MTSERRWQEETNRPPLAFSWCLHHYSTLALNSDKQHTSSICFIIGELCQGSAVSAGTFFILLMNLKSFFPSLLTRALSTGTALPATGAKCPWRYSCSSDNYIVWVVMTDRQTDRDSWSKARVSFSSWQSTWNLHTISCAKVWAGAEGGEHRFAWSSPLKPEFQRWPRNSIFTPDRPLNRCALQTKGLQRNAQLFSNKERKIRIP